MSVPTTTTPTSNNNKKGWTSFRLIAGTLMSLYSYGRWGEKKIGRHVRLSAGPEWLNIENTRVDKLSRCSLPLRLESSIIRHLVVARARILSGSNVDGSLRTSPPGRIRGGRSDRVVARPRHVPWSCDVLTRGPPRPRRDYDGSVGSGLFEIGPQHGPWAQCHLVGFTRKWAARSEESPCTTKSVRRGNAARSSGKRTCTTAGRQIHIFGSASMNSPFNSSASTTPSKK